MGKLKLLSHPIIRVYTSECGLNIVEKYELKPLLHPIVRAHTSWLQRKSADFQGTLKVHLRFYNKISRSYRPCNENLHAHFLCLHAGFLQTHPCLKGNLRET